MEHPNNIASISSVYGVRSVVAVVVLALAFSVLVGWQFEINVLKRPIPGSVAMNPLTALCFMLSAVALLGQAKPRMAVAFAWVTVGLALLKLISVLTGLLIPIDTILFSNKLNSDMSNGLSNSMAPNTALGFLLVGTALVLRWFKQFPVWVAEACVMLALAQGLLSIIGYGFRVPEFYGVLSMFPMAVHTAIGFLILSIGMLYLRPLGPFLTTFVDKGPGGLMARTLLPMAILLPIVLGMFRLYGERQELFSSEFGLMLIVTTVIGVFCLIIWKVAVLINRKDARQKEVERQLEEANVLLGERVEERTKRLKGVSLELETKAKELEEGEKRFRALVENGGDAVVVIGEDAKPTYASGSIFGMLGYTPEEVVGLELMKLIHPDDIQGVQKALENAFSQPGVPVPGYTSRVKHKNGSWRWLEATVTNLLHDPAVNGIVDNFRDVTDRVEAEALLAASEKRFHQAMDNMLEGVQIIGHDWEYLYINKALIAQGGYTFEELKGRTMMEMYPGVEESEAYKEIEISLKQRKARQLETLFTFPDGRSTWFELSIQPIPEGVFILSIDVTDRKKAEQELHLLNASLESKVAKRTAQLSASNKEMESFTYSVSHDLRAPLRAVNGFSQMLEQQYAPHLDDNGKRLLSIISSNAVTMGQLIDDLLEFSRTGRTKVQEATVDMGAVVSEVLFDMVQEAPEKAGQIKIADLHPAQCDPKLIRQVWGNLMSNAFKYSSNRADPQIRIWSDKEEDRVTYHIQDNGVGFDMKYADKLFGVFQRLHSKREFEGTGVGLAIASRIVGKHGGKIWADAELSKGSTFHFTLPSRSEAENAIEKQLKPQHHEQ